MVQNPDLRCGLLPAPLVLGVLGAKHVLNPVQYSAV